MQLIQTVTVGAGGASEIAFSSIPQTFTDLCLVATLRDGFANVSDDLLFKVNGTTITFRQLFGYGSGTSSQNLGWVVRGIAGNTATSNTFSSNQFYIPNYALTTINKSISVDSVTETNASEGYQVIGAGIYSSNTAVTSLTLVSLNSSNLVQYSSASLYGILKGSDGIVTVS